MVHPGILEHHGSPWYSGAPWFTLVLFWSAMVHPGILERHGSPWYSGAPWFTSVFGKAQVAHRFISLLCCDFCFVCHRSVSCVPSIASFSGLSILDCPFGFF
jgi:hypothetical protein